MGDKVVHEFEGEAGHSFILFSDGTIVERRNGHPIDRKRTHVTIAFAHLAGRIEELEAELHVERKVSEYLAAACGGHFNEKDCPCKQYDWDEAAAPKWCWDTVPCVGKTPKECWIRLAREET